MATQSPDTTSVINDTKGGPALTNIISLVKGNPAMTIALVAMGMVMVVFFIAWYGEREGRLAQYASATQSEDLSDTKARLSAAERELGELRQRALFHEECRK
jgi:hypothetical protein